MLNTVHLIGYLGADPSRRETAAGPCVTLRLATHRGWTGKDGARCEDTQWHSLLFWDRQAELADRILHRGQLVYAEGRLHYTSWPDRANPLKTYHRTEILVRTFRVLSAESGASTEPPVEDSGAVESGR